MQWGQDEARPADPAREVAAFLHRRLGSGPALLWTEGDHPDGEPSGAAPAHRAARWADTLRRLLGRAVEPAGELTPGEGSALLLFQHHGACQVRSTPGSDQGLRLRPGQWLLLPPGRGCHLKCRPGAEPLALRIPTA
ncbi:hypothetical protein AB0O31_26645 [Kitasatospora cineracea]|uniref:hypothetical protein n=1 Tax=Kitasatospora cineracea TaxID=88074 RepID=UPI00342B6393